MFLTHTHTHTHVNFAPKLQKKHPHKNVSGKSADLMRLFHAERQKAARLEP